MSMENSSKRKLLNPSPSYNWEDLDLDKVFNLTGIKLKDRRWKIYFTNFHLLQTQNHTEECKAKSLHAGYFGCKCTLGNALVAIWKAGSTDIDGCGRGREFFVNVPMEVVEDKTPLINPELRSELVQSRLYMGYEQLITLLKVYEVTELVLDFGPPLRLYDEKGFKKRTYIGEIRGDRLFEILYNEKEEEKCIEENSSKDYLPLPQAQL